MRKYKCNNGTSKIKTQKGGYRLPKTKFVTPMCQRHREVQNSSFDTNISKKLNPYSKML